MSFPKVLVISHLYPSSQRPSDGIFIHNEVKALKSAGAMVHVVTPVPWVPLILNIRPKWSLYTLIRKSGGYQDINVARYGYPAVPHPFNALNGLWIAARLIPEVYQIRRTFPFDLIHSHMLTPDGLAGSLLAKNMKVPSVCTVRGSDLNIYPYYSRTFWYATRFALQYNGAIITTSRALANAALTMAGRRVEPRVIYKGVERSIFKARGEKKGLRKALGIGERAPVMIFVGRCEHDKGLKELLQAFCRLRTSFQDLTLLVVGEGDYLSQFSRKIAEAGASGTVVLTGRVPHNRVVDYLSIADVFVLPSYNEGMPNALLEAMASGLPSIATNVGGNPEAIENGISGLLIPPKSSEALENAVLSILDHPEFAKRLGRAAAKRIALHFSWQANAQANLAVYRKLLFDQKLSIHR